MSRDTYSRTRQLVRESMREEETYNGWANRETWAFMLHVDNTIGCEFVADSLEFDDDTSDYAVGEMVADMVRDLLDECEGADWVRMMRSDVGSWWRIDYRAVGAHARDWGCE